MQLGFFFFSKSACHGDRNRNMKNCCFLYIFRVHQFCSLSPCDQYNNTDCCFFFHLSYLLEIEFRFRTDVQFVSLCRTLVVCVCLMCLFLVRHVLAWATHTNTDQGKANSAQSCEQVECALCITSITII